MKRRLLLCCGVADGFPDGARWLLFAFEQAHDDRGRTRPDWTTFHVPNAYAAQVAAAAPQRFAWVASIHPYREDALELAGRRAHAAAARRLACTPAARLRAIRCPA